MATALALASSRLSSDSHNNSPENTPSAVHRLQMAIADTECAQALLELAMSIVPSPPSSQDNSGLEQSEGKPSNPFNAGQSPKSLLKRELETPLETTSINEEENHRAELVKRIKLDHNYNWTGEDRKVNEVKLEPDQFRTYCETIKQNGSVPVSLESNLDEEYEGRSSPGVVIKSEKFNGSLEESKPVLSGPSYPSRSEIVRTVRQRTLSETCSGSVYKNPRQRSVSESKMGSVWRVKEERKTSILKSKSLKKNDLSEDDELIQVKQEPNKEDGNDCDGGMEADEKFHNFHLLMKCLVANEPDPIPCSESSRSSYRTQSMSSDDTDEGQRSSPDSVKHGSISHDYQCHVCQKTFLKKRYLTKHAFRMHPWLSGEEGTPIKITFEGFMCPHCKINIKPKKDLQRHIANCPKNSKRWKTQNELDLVNCQFCGVRMRRQLLVRHLAEEHCVDRMGDYSEDGSTYAQGLDDQGEGVDQNSGMLEDTKGEPGLSRGGRRHPHQGTGTNKARRASEPSEMSWSDVVEFGAIKKEPLEGKPVVFKAAKESCM